MRGQSPFVQLALRQADRQAIHLIGKSPRSEMEPRGDSMPCVSQPLIDTVCPLIFLVQNFATLPKHADVDLGKSQRLCELTRLVAARLSSHVRVWLKKLDKRTKRQDPRKLEFNYVVRLSSHDELIKRLSCCNFPELSPYLRTNRR